MKKKLFVIETHDGADKSFQIYGADIDLIIDYDDVNHDQVDKMSRKLVRILNEHWED